MADSNRGVWFLLGLSVGALVGVLYAPKTGEETRELLSRKADQGRDLLSKRASQLREQASGLREQAESFREQATDFAGRGKQAVTRQIDQFQAAVEAGRQAYRETVAAERSADRPENKPDASASRL